MISSLDHLVVLVDDLEQAQADWRSRGFTVVYGGEHTGGVTHNALVGFADGSYIELLAFKREDPTHRWWRHVAGGPGVIDFALLPSTIEVDVAAARSRGVNIEGPFPGGRVRPDGERIEWQTAACPAPDMPFLCADVTPRPLRVPQATVEQQGGVSGIASVTVLVAAIDEAVGRYAALLARSPFEDAELQRDVEWRAVFQLRHTQIILVQPLPDVADHPLAQRLATRGAGVVGYTFASVGSS